MSELEIICVIGFFVFFLLVLFYIAPMLSTAGGWRKMGQHQFVDTDFTLALF